MLGHPPGTSGPRTSVNTAKRGLLRAAHPTGWVRDVAAPRDPHTWRAQLRWGCLRRRPGPAACPSRKRSAADYRADLPGGADSRRPGRAFGGVGASGQPPAAANSSAQGWSLPGAREGPHWAPPEPTRDPRGGRRGQAGAPSPQTSARARAPPRVPSASGLRGGAAAGSPRGPGRPKRHRPQAPGRGVPEGAGPRAARPPRRGRRACGGGGAARGAQPIQGRGSKFHRPRSLRRPAPHSRALRAASPFRARYAAAILFTSLPLPAPPRTPHAWPQDTPPREDDVSTRWLNLQSPPPLPAPPPLRIGAFGPGRAPERGLVGALPRPRGGYGPLIGPWRRPSWAGGGKQAYGVEATAATSEGLGTGVVGHWCQRPR